MEVQRKEGKEGREGGREEGREEKRKESKKEGREKGRKEKRHKEEKANSLEMKSHIQLLDRCEGEKHRVWVSLRKVLCQL